MKVVIIINGRGGVGKDTLCDFAAEAFKTRNVSSITPIKEIAAQHGWNGEKDLKSRRFLWALKNAFTEYCDLPTRYLLDQFSEFSESDEQIMFAHIREADQINHFKNEVTKLGGKCLSLLIKRGESLHYGNEADDNVENYNYDLVYQNDKDIDKAKDDFAEFLKNNL
jgi:hypothetical protein